MQNTNRTSQASIWNLQGAPLRQAEAASRQALQRQPLDTYSLNVLARAHFDRGDDAEAIRLLSDAIYHKPKDFVSYQSLVRVYRGLKQRDNAAQMYDTWASAIASVSAEDVARESAAAAIPENDVTIDYMANYYAVRADEYDATCGYMQSKRIQERKQRYQELLRERDVIEIACGTGYWTEAIAQSARSVLATDRNAEQISIVQRKFAAMDNIRCLIADAYSLDNVGGAFSAAFSHFWWSHIPKSKITQFLSALHSRLAPGAVVIFADSLPYLDRPRRVDEEGNVVEQRYLQNGARYEVIKNFPIEADIRQALRDFGTDIRYDQDINDGIWTVVYRARSL